jgi:RNA polymerase sigma-70 factor (ECF subfamily)
VARHLCLNRARTRERAARAVDLMGRAEPEPAAQPQHLLEAREGAEALSLAVARLPTGLAELYRLRTAGLSYEELADILGVPLGTIRSRLHEMVNRLREEVSR